MANTWRISDFREDDPNLYMGVPKSELLNTPEEGLSETGVAPHALRVQLREGGEHLVEALPRVCPAVP